MMQTRKDALRILPLGGLGEIGMNLLLYGIDDHFFVCDCGVQFCDPWMVGAEHRLPDLDLLLEYKDLIRAIILTHGHEDHIGAVQFVGSLLKVPVYAPPFAAEIIRLKEEEYGSHIVRDLLKTKDKDVVNIGKMQIRFLRVTHSIPDTFALVIETPFGTIVHTSDFKMDDDPYDGVGFDYDGFKKIGDKGVRLLLSDSTNALVEGHTRTEKDAIEAVGHLIKEAKGRVLVSLFASNVHRVLGIIEKAQAAQKRVAIVGKSIHLYLEAYRRAGYLTAPLDLVDERRIERLDDKELVVICTGSQAEPRSALVRASLQDHENLRIHADDTVILSSRIIPGNEKAIFRMINNLARLGARVFHERVAQVHASGHACRDEERQMIRLLRPKAFIPIHGEYAFMKAHHELASEEGIQDCFLVENGHLIEVTKQGIEVVERMTLNHHYVDGSLVGDAEELRLDERRKMGWHGVVAVWAFVQKKRKRLGARCSIKTIGIPTVEKKMLDELEMHLCDEIEDMPLSVQKKQVEETIEGCIRGFFRRKIDKKPFVLSFVEFEED
jgi:ribonuclease J